MYFSGLLDLFVLKQFAQHRILHLCNYDVFLFFDSYMQVQLWSVLGFIL